MGENEKGRKDVIAIGERHPLIAPLGRLQVKGGDGLAKSDTSDNLIKYNFSPFHFLSIAVQREEPPGSASKPSLVVESRLSSNSSPKFGRTPGDGSSPTPQVRFLVAKKAFL